MDEAFLQARIDRLKLAIPAYEDAIDALLNKGHTQYTLNTGQDVQTVTRLDLVRLEAALDSMLNRLATLETRLTGSGVKYLRGVP